MAGNRKDVYLVVGGKYHDFDFARLEFKIDIDEKGILFFEANRGPLNSENRFGHHGSHHQPLFET